MKQFKKLAAPLLAAALLMGTAACGGAVRHHKRHGTQTVKQHDNQRRGHKIRQIDVLIVFDIGQRHADIEVSTHSLSLPSPGL